MNVFVGFDKREPEAFDVCRGSILRRSDANVIRLDERDLRFNGWFDRPWGLENGQKIDRRDGKPFSTDFAFTRFLVPALCLYQGWAVFCDSDFLFTRKIDELFAMRDVKFAVQVVKHNHVPAESMKMDRQRQDPYFRKNWSSLILWNCEHPSNRLLTTQAVNHECGQWLHAFSWLRDDEIGSLPGEWNWLSGVDKPLDRVPAGIHYTLGGPWFDNCKNVPYGDLWMREHAAQTDLRPACA